MPRFLTPEWVASFNAALHGVVLPGPGADAGLAAADGNFSVAQEVRGGPEGNLRLVLSVADGHLVLDLGPLGDPDTSDEPVGRPADVTIALGYDDAVALATGVLSSAEALNAGRIRVRGDLSVLAAGQEQLRAARQHTAALDADTTY